MDIEDLSCDKLPKVARIVVPEEYAKQNENLISNLLPAQRRRREDLRLSGENFLQNSETS